MLGLFGTLNLGARSLQGQQQGVEVAGPSLANVNNPAYIRQRISLQTSLAIPTLVGPEGTGADVAACAETNPLAPRAKLIVGKSWTVLNLLCHVSRKR